MGMGVPWCAQSRTSGPVWYHLLINCPLYCLSPSFIFSFFFRCHNLSLDFPLVIHSMYLFFLILLSYSLFHFLGFSFSLSVSLSVLLSLVLSVSLSLSLPHSLSLSFALSRSLPLCLPRCDWLSQRAGEGSHIRCLPVGFAVLRSLH